MTMNSKTAIKGKIHYVGVNDRNKHLFEGMWPLPYGVSYNSYLIDDEMVRWWIPWISATLRYTFGR